MEIKTFSPKSHKIKALIYGPSGSGKTTFWGTAENVLFASAENGLLSVANKKVAFTDIRSLEDLQELRDFLQNESHHFETLVIDSITEISDIIKNGIEKRTGKMMQIQDWGELANKIEKIIKDIKDIDINVIVIAQELYLNDSDKIQKIVPSLNGKSSTKICYYMDIVGYINTDKNGNRAIITGASDKYLTKDRTGTIWNNTELDFETWKNLVNWLALWEETVLYKTVKRKELPTNNKQYNKNNYSEAKPANKQITASSTKPLSEKQQDYIKKLWDKLEYKSEDSTRAFGMALRKYYKKETLEELTSSEASDLITKINKQLDENKNKK